MQDGGGGLSNACRSKAAVITAEGLVFDKRASISSLFVTILKG